MNVDYDIIIIGAGVMGLSIARSLGKLGYESVLLIDKEKKIGTGISSRSSEVIHSGIYNAPESLKSKLCIEGRDLLYDYCEKNNIYYKNCGKIIISGKNEKNTLLKLYELGKNKGLKDIKILDKEEIQNLEPNICSDFGLLINETGIVDSHSLMNSFYNKSLKFNHDYLFATTVQNVLYEESKYKVFLKTINYEEENVTSKWIINAAGLYSDSIFNMLACESSSPNLYFNKGNYFSLSSSWRNNFKHLIYPLPAKNHQTLGVHITFDKSGNVRLGPDSSFMTNKVEDYSVDEKLLNKFYEGASKYIIGLNKDDLSPDYAGIRPKIQSSDYNVNDFYICHEVSKGFKGWINLIGIESPGLTSCISIANMVTSWISD